MKKKIYITLIEVMQFKRKTGFEMNVNNQIMFLIKC